MAAPDPLPPVSGTQVQPPGQGWPLQDGGPGAGPARWLTAAGVLGILACYLPALHGPFFSDDFIYVVDNMTLRSVGLSEFWRIFAQQTNPWEFLPLRDLSYRLDMALFDQDPLGYRIHNLLLYALCCVAVWLLTGRLARLLGPEGPARGSRAAWVSAVTTLIFAAHPAHVESVAWISGRKDLLSGLLALLALHQFAGAVTPARPRWGRLSASLALTALALLSKATVLPLPLVALFIALGGYAAAGRGLSMRQALLRSALAVSPLALLAAAWLAVVVSVGGETGVLLPMTQAAQQEAGRHIMAPLRILGGLGEIALAPVRLRLIYDLYNPGRVNAFTDALGLALLLAGILGAWVAWRRGSLAGLGALAFLAFSLPFCRLIPFSSWSLVSERFLFLPVLGLALALAAWGTREGARVRLPLLLVATLAGAVLSAARASGWTAPEAFWAENARLEPQHNVVVAQLLDAVLLPARRFDAALAAARQVRSPTDRDVLSRLVAAQRAAVRGDWAGARAAVGWLLHMPSEGLFPRLQLLLGHIHEREGNDFRAARLYAEASRDCVSPDCHRLARQRLDLLRARHSGALRRLRQAAERAPHDLPRLGTLANLEMELGYLEQAEEKFRRILARSPGLAVARFNLGLVLLRRDRPAEAARALKAAVAGGVRSASALNSYAVASRRAGELGTARGALEEALRLDPRRVDAAVNLAMLLRDQGELRRARSVLDALERQSGSPELGQHLTHLRRSIDSVER